MTERNASMLRLTPRPVIVIELAPRRPGRHRRRPPQGCSSSSTVASTACAGCRQSRSGQCDIRRSQTDACIQPRL